MVSTDQHDRLIKDNKGPGLVSKKDDLIITFQCFMSEILKDTSVLGPFYSGVLELQPLKPLSKNVTTDQCDHITKL